MKSRCFITKTFSAYCILCLSGFPAFVVGICLAATQTQGYGYHGNQTVCWLAVDNGLIWAFVAPAIAILLVYQFCLIYHES